MIRVSIALAAFDAVAAPCLWAQSANEAELTAQGRAAVAGQATQIAIRLQSRA